MGSKDVPGRRILTFFSIYYIFKINYISLAKQETSIISPCLYLPWVSHGTVQNWTQILLTHSFLTEVRGMMIKYCALVQSLLCSDIWYLIRSLSERLSYLVFVRYSLTRWRAIYQMISKKKYRLKVG